MPQTKKNKTKTKKINKALDKLDHYASPESREVNRPSKAAVVTPAIASLNRSINRTRRKGADPGMVRELATYAKALVDPESVVNAKVPDQYTIPTATYQAVYTLMTPGNSNPASGPIDLGRFCIVVKPTLGTRQGFDANEILSTVQYTADSTQWQGQFNAINYAASDDPNVSMIVPDKATNHSGLAMRARVVSASIWSEYEGSTLLDGGSISACFIPADSWAMQFTSASGLVNGNLTYWENLAEVRNSYQGKLKDGAYVWWKPNAPSDVSFYPVDNAMPNRFKEQTLPIMVVAGIIPTTTGGVVPGQPSLIRHRIVINYEYETTSRVVTSENSPFIAGAVDVAETVLQHIPMAMANGTHESWINTVARAALAGAAGFVLGGPIGAAAGALGSLGVGAASK